MIKAGKRKRKRYTVLQGVRSVQAELPKLPAEDESIVMLSMGSFASISVIYAIAENEPIRRLYVSTFRVGKKESLALKRLHESGRLDECGIVVCGLMSEDARDKYPYFRVLAEVCEQCGFIIKSAKNHSKVILAETDQNAYVVETSSNLNENPKIEQFRIENDAELLEFYRRNLFEAI